MEKARKLRQALETAIEDFKINPNNLLMWVTERKTIPSSDDLSFLVKYNLSIQIRNQSGDFSAIETLIINWAKSFCPDKLSTQDARDDFLNADIEILDDNNYHADLILSLTENVKVTKNANGTLMGEYLPEPIFDDFFDGDENLKNEGSNPQILFENLIVKFANE